VKKYLEHYAEPGTAAATDIPAAGAWQQVVVIPVCNEDTAILRTLPPAPGRSLMVLVVNQTEVAPGQVTVANQDFAAEVQARFELLWQSDPASGLSLFKDPTSPRDVLLVDRFSKGLQFSSKGGVGHARKTGADLAVNLYHRQQVLSPWIHCSDADVVLPPRYFTCTTALGNTAQVDTAALIYPFRHGTNGDPEGNQVAQVTQMYEYSLHYYVAGLRFAGSPYAFHTIGSTMAVNANHYAKVRGFPRRQAGEDFYLLNKLAKVGSIRQLISGTECEPVEIAARLSDRVPFGTGAAVGKMVELQDPARDFLLYHPGVFELLRIWLDSLPDFWQARSCDVSGMLSPYDQPALIDGLRAVGAEKALQHAIKQSSDETQFSKQMHTWFDAFRTLKLIHYLRDHLLPSVAYEELKGSEPFNLANCVG
jgi:hypothetical protein